MLHQSVDAGSSATVPANFSFEPLCSIAAEAYDSLRQADAITRLMQISLEWVSEQLPGNALVKDVADLAEGIEIVRNRIDLTQQRVAELEITLRRHNRASRETGEGAHAENTDDPPGGSGGLLAAIRAMEAGMAKYTECAPEDDAGADAFIAESYGPPLAVLASWSRAATSMEEAVAALRLARREISEFQVSDVAEPMLRAALGYLDPCADANKPFNSSIAQSRTPC